MEISVPKHRVEPDDARGWLDILGASENNLKNVDVHFPIGLFTCVTGVSGSGNSTLVDDILRKQLARDWYGAKETPGKCREIRGTEHFRKIVVVDQEPIGTEKYAVPDVTQSASLAEDGTVNKTAFYVSWDGHFSKKDDTYINEKNYAKENGVNATFRRALFDAGTKRNIISDIKKADCCCSDIHNFIVEVIYIWV